MLPRQRAAGAAGVAAGVGLLAELALFLASGWTPEIFRDLATALSFLESGGMALRAAAFVGFANLGFTVLFVAGLAGALHTTAPTRAAALLYLGLVGIAAHALVPLGLWLGPPMFLRLAAAQQQVALGAWAGFAAFLDAAGGVGYLFSGAAFAAAGSAILGSRFPSGLGWTAVLGGVAAATTVALDGTPVAFLSAVLSIPALVLIIACRIWAGICLWRTPDASASESARPRSRAAGSHRVV